MCARNEAESRLVGGYISECNVCLLSKIANEKCSDILDFYFVTSEVYSFAISSLKPGFRFFALSTFLE